ncbi:hypothetical protein NNC19_08245 [Clostridium sp. SHJSY1]|uniref:hypothetical protein n=1 Tax=Clostridium sp. SHJSY1 TaxID=2942483 RepID=UPI0028760152|nr:hypothetical protein [Clostridium sp. SHJSY1]MDS0525665.1 hypothetical protein [Clostridium sp. SHJSY1]
MSRKKTKDDIISQIKYGTRHPWKAVLRVIKRGSRVEGYIKDKGVYIAVLGTTLDVSLVIDVLLLILPEYSIMAALSKIFFSYIFSLIILIFIIIVGEEIYSIYKLISKMRK